MQTLLGRRSTVSFVVSTLTMTVFVVGSLFSVGTCILYATFTQFMAGERGQTTAVVKQSAILPAGQFHKELKRITNYKGVLGARICNVDSTKFTDDTPVVGIMVNGLTCAFPRETMLATTHHIVNLSLRRTPISVTYCNLADNVRVFTAEDKNQPIDLRVGGLDVDNQMVLLLDGIRYGQSCQDIPLQDFPFETTTLGEWRYRYPNSLVYEGGPAS